MKEKKQCYREKVQKLMNKRNWQIDLDIFTLEDHLKYSETVGERLELQEKINSLRVSKQIIPSPLKTEAELLCYEAEFEGLQQEKYDWQKAQAFWEEFDLFMEQNMDKFDLEGTKQLVRIAAKIRRWV
jgi:hypothetical protein